MAWMTARFRPFSAARLIAWTLAFAGAAALGFPAPAQDGDEEEVRRDDAATLRKAWLDEQLAFALRLAERNWLDVAETVLDETRKGDARVRQPAPDAAEQVALNRVGVRLRALAAERLPDLAERRAMGEEAVAKMEEIVESLNKDMLARYTAMNKAYDDVRKANKGDIPNDPAVRERLARLQADAVGSRDVFEEAQRDLATIYVDLARTFAREAQRTPDAARRRLARFAALQWYQRALAGEDAVGMAAAYTLADRNMLYYNRLINARKPDQIRRATTNLRNLLATRARYSHKIEEAFALWATLVNRPRDPEDPARYLQDVRALSTAIDAELKKIDGEIKAAGNDEAKKRPLAARRSKLTADRKTAGAAFTQASQLAGTILTEGTAFFEMAEGAYDMIAEDRQIYHHWMKYLAAFDDPLFVTSDDDIPNALGKDPDQCAQCHLHADQKHTQDVTLNFLTAEYAAERRKFENPREGRKVVDEKKTEKEVVNDLTQGKDKVVEVVWKYEEKCPVCHLHRARHNPDAIDGRVPAASAAAERPLTYYNRYSDRARYLFMRHFGWNAVRYEDDSGKTRTDRNDTLDPSLRALGYFGYVDALTSFAQGALQRARDEKDALKKADWEKQAAELVTRVDEAMGDLMNERPRVFDGKVQVEPWLRARARLELAMPWWVMRGRMASAQKKPAAEVEQYFSRAMRESSLAPIDGGPAWRRRSQDAIVEVAREARAALGRDLEQTGDMALAKADDAFGRFQRTVRGTAERRAMAKDIRRNYTEALNALQKLRYGQLRYAQVPMVLYRLADAAIARDDYPTAYVALFQLLQEFNERMYPRARFGSMAEQNTRLVNAAAAVMPMVATHVARQLNEPEWLIDGLRMSIAAVAEPPQERLARYANELKKIGRGAEALEVMTRVDPDNPYYGIMQLNAADIHREQVAIELKRAGDDALPAADRAAARAAADAAFAAMEKAVATFFEKIQLENRPERPGDEYPDAQRIYDQNTDRIPQALLLPIRCLRESGRYAEADARAGKMLETLDTLKTLSPERRAEARTSALAQRYFARIAMVDLEDADLAATEKKLEAADEAMATLAEADEAGQFVNAAYQQVGQSWLVLADKIRLAGDADRAAALGLRAAVTINKATRLMYQSMVAALRTGGIFVQNRNYADAVRVFTNAIDFWNNGLFTPDYLLTDGKELKDVPAAKPDAALAGAFGAVSAAAGWKGLAGVAVDEQAVAGRLNEFVKAADWAKLTPALKPFLAAAGDAHKTRRPTLAAKIAGALAMLERDDLAANPAVGNRLMRTALEAAYPDWWPQAPLVENLPTAAAFEDALRGFAARYATSNAGRRKGTLLLAMHDKTALTGDVKTADSPRGVLAARRKALADILEKGDDAEKPAARREAALYEPDLRTFLFGQMRAGKLRQRSYLRARTHIRGMRDWAAGGGYAIPEERDGPVPLPTEPFLQSVEKALRFESELLMARRQYAEALVNVGGRENETRALDVFEGLVEYYPEDSGLLLALAQAESKVAYNLATGPGGYDVTAANHYLRARYYLQYQLRDRLPRQSEGWWNAVEQIQANHLQEITLRKQQNKPAVNGSVTFESVRADNKIARYPLKTASLQAQAEALFTDLNRMRQLNDPDNPEVFNAERQERFDAIDKALRDLGFAPKELPQVELSL